MASMNRRPKRGQFSRRRFHRMVCPEVDQEVHPTGGDGLHAREFSVTLDSNLLPWVLAHEGHRVVKEAIGNGDFSHEKSQRCWALRWGGFFVRREPFQAAFDFEGEEEKRVQWASRYENARRVACFGVHRPYAKRGEGFVGGELSRDPLITLSPAWGPLLKGGSAHGCPSP